MDKRFLHVRLKEAKLFSDSGRESFGGTARGTTLKLWGDFELVVIVMYQIVWGKVERFLLLRLKKIQDKNNTDVATVYYLCENMVIVTFDR